MQIVEEEDEFKFDFDLLDATKIIPEELVPVRRIGKMTLNRNTDNYFAETEQVAFHLGHVVPGIDFSNDPLLQGRLFSYTDAQITRVGPNFAELPINRPLNPVHNNQREGHARIAVNTGRVAYFPNSLGGGCPMHRPESLQAFRSHEARVDGTKVRQRRASFADQFSQPTMFWNSMAEWEKKHIAAAFSFELNQVQDDVVRARTMNEMLVNISDDLARRVSHQTGIKIARAGSRQTPTPSAPSPSGPLRDTINPASSPALSMDKPCLNLAGRRIAVLAGHGVDGGHLTLAVRQLSKLGLLPEIIAAQAGTISASDASLHKVNRAAPNAPSVIYDAVVIPGGKSAAVLAKSALAVQFVMEAYSHGKPLLALGEGELVLKAAGIGEDSDEGVIVNAVAGDWLADLTEALREHRFHERATDRTPAS